MILSAALLVMQASANLPSTDHCREIVEKDGKRASRYVGDRACFRFDPPRLYTGVWTPDFERSSFCENIRDVRQVAGCEQVWLSIDNSSVLPPGFARRDGSAYRIVFIGRKASKENDTSIMGYGHLGGSSGLIIVDRLTTWEDIGFPD